MYSLFKSPPFWMITSFQSLSTSAISQFAEQNLSNPPHQKKIHVSEKVGEETIVLTVQRASRHDPK
jgi:hypothetical protein